MTSPIDGQTTTLCIVHVGVAMIRLALSVAVEPDGELEARPTLTITTGEIPCMLVVPVLVTRW
jgi:hypothetical protein